MYRFTRYILLALLTQLNMGCGEDKTDSPAGDPSNLELVVENFNDGSGNVSVQASGENVAEYEFDMGDGSDLIVNNTGTVSHNYEEDGTYTIEVKAYGVSGRFLRATKLITIGSEDTGEIDDSGYSTPLTYSGMTLLWNDEFEGSSLNETYWNFEMGTGSNGWGNNELQYYRKENTSLDQGYLIIEAKKETFGGRQYTSSRITTQDKLEFSYGRIDIRAKLPQGQGIWPAIWMLGANFNSVGWPYCGEIDIMEMIGGGDGRDDVVHGTVHWDNDGEKADYGGSEQLQSGIFNDEFHVFTITWDASSITWYLDDEQYHVIDTTPASLSEFRNEFFFIFNVAVGGNWPGSPNSSTNFPQRMIVDYVRVFQTD